MLLLLVYFLVPLFSLPKIEKCKDKDPNEDLIGLDQPESVPVRVPIKNKRKVIRNDEESVVQDLGGK